MCDLTVFKGASLWYLSGPNLCNANIMDYAYCMGLKMKPSEVLRQFKKYIYWGLFSTDI